MPLFTLIGIMLSMYGGFPKGTPEAPEGTPEAPEGTPEAPEGAPEAPEGTPDPPYNRPYPHVPKGTPDDPFIPPYPYDPIGTPTASTSAPGTPTKAPEVPTKAPGVPIKAPGVPTKAPGVSTKAPEVSTSTPDAPTYTPNIPTKAPSLPTKAPEVPISAQGVSTTGPAFHGSPIHAQMTGVSQREMDLLDKLASAMQSLAKDIKLHSCRQSTWVQGHDSAQGIDFLESSKRISELCIDLRDLLEAQQSLRGSLLSPQLDGPGDLRMQALVEHRKMVTAFLSKDQSISDELSEQLSEAGILSEETPHVPTPPVPEEPSDEERDMDMAKD